MTHHVVGGEGLAQEAGIERVHGLVGHGLEAAVAFIIDLAGERHAPRDFRFIGD